MSFLKKPDMTLWTDKSHHTVYSYTCIFHLWEFLSAYEQRIEGICAIGTVFEEILFRLCQLFTSFVLVEAIAPTSHTRSLNSENQVIVILTV